MPLGCVWPWLDSCYRPIFFVGPALLPCSGLRASSRKKMGPKNPCFWTGLADRIFSEDAWAPWSPQISCPTGRIRTRWPGALDPMKCIGDACKRLWSSGTVSKMDCRLQQTSPEPERWVRGGWWMLQRLCWHLHARWGPCQRQHLCGIPWKGPFVFNCF